ncbi:N-acetylglucosaminyl deacetylase, LmbE family [Micropruina glycogenica]|uniref:N-acetylglucosaminyl deacetylase, LmbE family n=2 Tax=Micropruina glycogenica TaxID=75385 RepID=A0A2N9JC60_9ACTN|nr:N-acetylglucosaminyl deacetylase, LmbE family [Micropruina glycogenica]
MSIMLPDGPLTVLCLAAHPDDIEIACGGTLLTLGRDRELDAVSLVLTGTAERRAEAAEATEAFLPGARLEFGGEPGDFADGYLPEQWGRVKRRLHELAAHMAVPHLVFAPRPDDAHQDHRLLGRLAPTVWRNSTIMHYEIPKWDGDLGRPNVYVPLADDIAREKVRALNECYPSQHSRDWWDDELFLGFMRVRGMECKGHYAEAFVVNKLVMVT